jgi:hypothetical protein
MKKYIIISFILSIGGLFILLGAKCPWEKDKETGSSYRPSDPFIWGTWAYDGNDWQLLHPVQEPPPRGMHAMAYDSTRDKVVLFGGDGPDGPEWGYFNDTWEFDGTNWILAFPATTSLTAPFPRVAHAMAYDSARQKTVLFGGVMAGVNKNDTLEWDGTNWAEKFPATPPRSGMVIVWLMTRHGVRLYYLGDIQSRLVRFPMRRVSLAIPGNGMA